MEFRKAQAYDRSFKLAALEQLAAGESMSGVALSLGIRRELLCEWRKVYRKGGAAALRGRGRPSLAAKAALARSSDDTPPDLPSPDALALARRRIEALERKIGRQALELDFFAAAQDPDPGSSRNGWITRRQRGAAGSPRPRMAGRVAHRRLRPPPGSGAAARRVERDGDVHAARGQPGRLLSELAPVAVERPRPPRAGVHAFRRASGTGRGGDRSARPAAAARAGASALRLSPARPAVAPRRLDRESQAGAALDA
jgi:transposase